MNDLKVKGMQQRQKTTLNIHDLMAKVSDFGNMKAKQQFKTTLQDAATVDEAV